MYVMHCDWSNGRKKRWMATAERFPDGKWLFSMPELVPELNEEGHRSGALQDNCNLLKFLGRRPEQTTIVGFDFPIGICQFMGEKTGADSYRTLLNTLATKQLKEWLSVCCTAHEISAHRPFYPNCNVAKGDGSRQKILTGVGASEWRQLLRNCERGGNGTKVAQSPFLTIGAGQVGKAMIAGWKSVIIPARELSIWPFDGDLQSLIDKGGTILCETYPGDVYARLGFPKRGWSKTKVEGRKACAPFIHAWLARHAVGSSRLYHIVEDGFTKEHGGEDGFDALVGLIGMLDVIDGRQPEGAPQDETTLRWEGWILGRVQEARSKDPTQIGAVSGSA